MTKETSGFVLFFACCTARMWLGELNFVFWQCYLWCVQKYVCNLIQRQRRRLWSQVHLSETRQLFLMFVSNCVHRCESAGFLLKLLGVLVTVNQVNEWRTRWKKITVLLNCFYTFSESMPHFLRTLHTNKNTHTHKVGKTPQFCCKMKLYI